MRLTNEELDAILAKGGLVLNQEYNPSESYRKDRYLFTKCAICGVEAHYRLKYILDKNAIGEVVCRSCFWHAWYVEDREFHARYGMTWSETGDHDMTWEEAERLADDNGYELVDLMRGVAPGDDVLLVRCRRCGRQTAERPFDVEHGCPCTERSERLVIPGDAQPAVAAHEPEAQGSGDGVRLSSPALSASVPSGPDRPVRPVDDEVPGEGCDVPVCSEAAHERPEAVSARPEAAVPARGEAVRERTEAAAPQTTPSVWGFLGRLFGRRKRRLEEAAAERARRESGPDAAVVAHWDPSEMDWSPQAPDHGPVPDAVAGAADSRVEGQEPDADEACDAIRLTDGQQAAFDAIMSGDNVFLSGSAGTGKSFVVSRVLAARKEGVIACAPTARAALLVGGSTLHSAFHLPVAPIVNPDHLKVPEAIRTCDMVLIDEISMVRRDVFDAVSSILLRENSRRLGGKNPEHPHPIQLVCVGDFCQLPPVFGKEQAEVLAAHYGVEAHELERSLFAFQSDSWARWGFDDHYLTEVVRQHDGEFVEALNQARVGDARCVKWFNAHALGEEQDNAVIIEGRNRDVDEHNAAMLARIDGPARTYLCAVEGETCSPLPAPKRLELKVGARVMVTANADGLVNGELGTVVQVRSDSVVFRSDDGATTVIGPHTWTYHRYGVERAGGVDHLKKEAMGRFTQLPLRLGWAVSIHKSQGQTYDATAVNPKAWDVGMLYVALSRVRSVQRLRLVQPISPRWLLSSKEVQDFYATIPGAPHFEGQTRSHYGTCRPAKDFVARNPDAINSDNPIYGKGVVFTGDFSDGTERDDLRQLVADLGGTAQARVSGRTDYVVQGNWDYGQGVVTAKIRTARENVASGKRDTKIISESEWHALVDEWVVPIEVTTHM